MKCIDRRLSLLLLYALSTIHCSSSLFHKLQGGSWVEKVDIEHRPVNGITNTEPSDFIFFHKGGRYFIFNDLDGRHIRFPLVERGNWSIKNNNQIVLIEDGSATAAIKDGQKFLRDYEKIPITGRKMERFRGTIGSDKVKFGLPLKGVLLKLTYHLLSPVEKEGSSAEVIMEDQEGHELWKKTLLFGHQQKTEEIILGDIIADNPEMFEQDELLFKIRCQFGWVLKVKLYEIGL
jgi:hypothetical protein